MPIIEWLKRSQRLSNKDSITSEIKLRRSSDFDFAMQNIRAIASVMQDIKFEEFRISCKGKLPMEYCTNQLLVRNESDLIQVQTKQVDAIACFTFKLDLCGIYKEVIVPESLRDRLWGFAPDEFIGCYMESILPTAIAKERRKYFKQAIAKGISVAYEQIIPGSTKIVSIFPDSTEVIVTICDAQTPSF